MMDEDLVALDADSLVAEVKRLRAGIRKHRDSSGHELCWHHPQLWSLLPEQSDPLPTVPNWPQFLPGCLAYRESLDKQLPTALRTRNEFSGRPGPASDTTEVVLWRRLDLPGHEISHLDAVVDGWRLSGTALFLHEMRPCKLDYVVSCDSAWHTQSAHITGVMGRQPIDLRVSVDTNRRWRLNGMECAAVEGSVDIDLAFSPSTNLLPIRRLELAVGDEAQVKAAWLQFPSLRLEPLPQIYRHEGDRSYRYESAAGTFVRMLEVNASGFIVRYPGLWEVESVSTPSND